MSSNNRRNVVIGAVAVSALVLLGWYLTSNSRSNTTGAASGAATGSSAKETKTSTDKRDTKVTVESVEDIGEDETDDSTSTPNAETPAESAEEIAAKAAEAATKKKQYDDANRMASKLIAGQAYAKAAAKLTEAIELADGIPSAGDDILKLYNNRSAMYEKIAEYNKAMSDINVVLTMDPFHIKARVRRARVHDARKNAQEALDDYVYAMFLERIKGDAPSNDRKIETLCKSIGSARAKDALKQIRSSGDRLLPSTTYCRNFFENFPSLHIWKAKFSGTSSSARSSLVDAVTSAAQIDDENEKMTAQLSATLDLVCFDIDDENYQTAFDSLIPAVKLVKEHLTNEDEVLQNNSVDLAGRKVSTLVALVHELAGTEFHLKCNLDKAIEAYSTSLRLAPMSLDTKLKLASLHLDLGERDKAEAMYTEMMKREGDHALTTVEQAWVFVHSSSLWLTRNEHFAYPPNAVTHAMTAVDAALKLTQKDQKDDSKASSYDTGEECSRKAARFVSLMKSVHILSSVKAQLNETPTPEELQRNTASVREAKTLFPTKLTVLLLEADQKQMEGQIEEAMGLLENAVKIASASGDGKSMVDVTLIKASALTSQAFSILQNPASGQLQLASAQGTFVEVEKLYKDALDLDPNAIEVMAQYAQLKSMIMGDFQGAVTLLERALPLARSSDEVQELCQLLVMNEAQKKTMEALQSQELQAARS